ncbi:hypothetical protein Tco_1178876 [Tanacetum coccineum]
MDNSFTLGSNEEAYHVNILQSCNGLLLCSGSGSPAFYYVYNPSTNMFKMLSFPENSHDDSDLYATGVLGMAFDLTKLHDYKVVQLFACLHGELEIQVYSSETETEDRQLTLYKFHIDDHGHTIITTLEIPNGFHQGSNFLQSFGAREGSYDPMFIQIDIPAILHLQRRLFESRGCLLLVSRDDIDSKEFTIYEMVKGCPVWTVRYVVNTDEFMTPLPDRWSIWSTVWSIGLAEREEDSFLVINISGKVVKYNIISKTISQIFDIGSNEMDDEYELFPAYKVAHNPYEFIPRRKIPNLDLPAGIFANNLRSLFECDFVSLDLRLNSKKSTIDHSFGSAEEVDHVRILQSCNGLLPCSSLAWPVFYYVYNPSTNLFKRLWQPNYYLCDDSCVFNSGIFRLAFDPRKSVYYKVVQAGGEYGETWIRIYSLEIGNWNFYKDRFSYFSFDHFESAIYWNDAFHWLEGLNRELKHYKLNIEDHDHPIMTSLEIPYRDDIGFTEFTIYEMMKGYSVWSVRFGRKGRGVFFGDQLIWKGCKIQPNIKSIIEISILGSNQMDDDDDAVVFILPFKVDPNLYEFIPFLASV